MLTGISLVILLVVKERTLRSLNNGFDRKFTYQASLYKKTLLTSRPQSIAGFRNDSLYLSTLTSGKLVVVPTASLVPRVSFFNLASPRITPVHNVFRYECHNRGPILFSGNTRQIIQWDWDGSLREVANVPGQPFIYAKGIGANKFVMRQLNAEGTDMEFTLFDAGQNTVETVKDPTEPSGDRGLKTDGSLSSDLSENLFTYVHYYSRKVIVFDTILQPVTRFSTIDRSARQDSSSAGRPGLTLHQTSTAYKGLLLICSNLKADNETEDNYRRNIPVDLYKSRTGQYLGSFYLPVSEGMLIKNMMVIPSDNTLLLATLYYNSELAFFKVSFLDSLINLK